jgi:hypothetical protein
MRGKEQKDQLYSVLVLVVADVNKLLCFLTALISFIN